MHRSLALLALGISSAISAQGTTYHVRVDQTLTSAQHQLLHARYGGDCGGATTGAPEFYLHPDEYAEVTRLGIRTKVLARGRPYAQIAAAQAQHKLVPDTNYFTVAETLAEIDRYATAYPSIAMRVDVTALTKTAKTHDGNSIYALKLSDNVRMDEDEPALLLASQHHARELNSPVIVFGAIDRLLKGYASDPAIKSLIDSYEIYCVPMVNPDGVDRVWNVDNMWRKNGRGSYGVDLNRNYSFLWGRCGASTRTSSQTYRGPSAGSEPETQTMMALHRMLRPEQYHDFHSSGREVLFTYAPCATVNATINSLLTTYINDLRAPMSYATRKPSASGEAPEWSWADGGTLSFLTEISTSFQPAYSSALSEAARVWPGIRKATTTWRPAVRGHVRSIYQDEPIEATIRFSPNLFNHGERTRSRARDGRYGLWLPIGTHQVTFSATGFRSVTRTVNVTSYNSSQALEIHMVPTMPAATLSKLGTDRIGTTTDLTYLSTGDVGETYIILLSLGTSPGIDAGADRVVPLNPDIAFSASLPPGILVNNLGKLPASGQVTSKFPIPNITAFVGLQLYAAGVTVNAKYLASVKNFSAAVGISIKP